MAAISKKFVTGRAFLTANFVVSTLCQRPQKLISSCVPMMCHAYRHIHGLARPSVNRDSSSKNCLSPVTSLQLNNHPNQLITNTHRLVSTTTKNLSSSTITKTAPIPQQALRQVWVSKSQDIFTNLALEDWLYRHRPFTDEEGLLLLWRNAPCVVIGRHQNPWAECDVPGCLRDGVHVARRNSGGGAVYHDLGNACVSFFTSRDQYDRKANLQLLVEAITRTWPVDLVVNDRDDIILDQKFKISGTAAKLGGKTAYHHCTLLTDVNKANLQQYLSTKVIGLESRATESVRSEVRNLREADPSVDWEGLVSALSMAYLGDSPKQLPVAYVDPDSTDAFPGLPELRVDLRGSQWTYIRTPKFTLRRTFLDLSGKTPRNLDICLEIDKGRLSTINLEGLIVQNVDALRNMIVLHLQDQIFSREAIETAFETTYGNIMDVDSAKVCLWIWQCFKNLS